VRALTWNLYHGRSPKPARTSLFGEFARALAAWEWDVALLQEVPPWWPEPLAQATHAQQRHVLTSRTFGLPLRRAISVRNPDILKANGGGANAILVRGEILGHAGHRLTWWPERRYAHAVRIDRGWVVNLHASTHRDEWARRDVDRARAAFPDAFLFGGDLNLRGRPAVEGMRWLGGNHVDHLYGHTHATYEVLERGRLSDHPPVRVTL
jgi:endonuclease/exonuclease/phosphatase family metal-dependent hydrolase